MGPIQTVYFILRQNLRQSFVKDMRVHDVMIGSIYKESLILNATSKFIHKWIEL